jgi:SAM-dependent methyltransferase
VPGTASRNPYVPHAWETVPCPFCGSMDASVYERFGSELQYTYVLCRGCRLVYSSPRPKYDAHFLEAAYASYYQLSEDLDVSDETDVPHSSVSMFRRELEHLCRFDRRRSAVLDVGSSVGTFLYAAKPLFGEAVGLDVSPSMAAFVERKIGVRIFVQQFQDFEHPRRFSLIHMSHVIEHVPDPNRWLEKAKALLEPDGILVLNVPNKFSLSARTQHLGVRLRLKRQFSSGWSDPARTPDHLFEPTVPSMLCLLEKHRYDVLDAYSYSRRDPISSGSLPARFFHRTLKLGSNLAFITRPRASDRAA